MQNRLYLSFSARLQRSQVPQTGCVMSPSLYRSTSLMQPFLTPFRVCITRLILFVFMEVSWYNACWWYTWPSPFVAIRHRVNDADAAMRTSEALWVHKPGTHPRWSVNVKVDASRLFAKLEVGVYKLARVNSAVLRPLFGFLLWRISGIVRQSRSNLWVF